MGEWAGVVLTPLQGHVSDRGTEGCSGGREHPASFSLPDGPQPLEWELLALAPWTEPTLGWGVSSKTSASHRTPSSQEPAPDADLPPELLWPGAHHSCTQGSTQPVLGRLTCPSTPVS